MDYGLIGKLEKAKRYAEDRKRFRFKKFNITFYGDSIEVDIEDESSPTDRLAGDSTTDAPAPVKKKKSKIIKKSHIVSYDNGVFHCDCEFFLAHKRCGHTMALEILLKDMIKETVEA